METDCQGGETAGVPAGSTIRYGANGKFVTRALAGKVAYNNMTFGDPSPNGLKTCELFVPTAPAAEA